MLNVCTGDGDELIWSRSVKFIGISPQVLHGPSPTAADGSIHKLPHTGQVLLLVWLYTLDRLGDFGSSYLPNDCGDGHPAPCPYLSGWLPQEVRKESL